MARRKRLTPVQMDPVQINAAHPVSEAESGPEFGPESGSAEGRAGKSSLPPIAQVAGQSATEAAFQEVAGEMRRAREEGRLIQVIPLGAIVEDHLVRDRMVADDEDMAALMASIRARGQTTPIEVVETAPGKYGLISGWRRLQALRRLRGSVVVSGGADDGRFATVRALVISPRDAGESYVAMVEENEIRADLSHYERARIVARSVQAGAFADAPTALRTLFANASRAKRSKIKSFMSIVEALDDVLRFPTHLGERLGLELAGRLHADPGFANTLRALDARTPEAEAEQIRAALSHGSSAAKTPQEAPTRAAVPKADVQDIVPGIALSQGRNGLTLSGVGVTDELRDALVRWLRAR